MGKYFANENVQSCEKEHEIDVTKTGQTIHIFNSVRTPDAFTAPRSSLLTQTRVTVTTFCGANSYSRYTVYILLILSERTAHFTLLVRSK